MALRRRGGAVGRVGLLVQVSGDGDGADTNTISYGDALCGSQYKRASLVAICLAAFQQLTGINVVMFYSS